MAETTVRGQIGDKDVAFTAGKLAQLADGAVVAKVGTTEVLVANRLHVATQALLSRPVCEPYEVPPVLLDRVARAAVRSELDEEELGRGVQSHGATFARSPQIAQGG